LSRGLVDEAQHPQEQHAIILELLRTRKAGVGFGRGSDNRLTEEAWSRLMLKDAILSLRMYDPEAYLAINEIFNAGICGYRDLEFYRQYGSKTQHKRRQWLLLALHLEPHVSPGPLYHEAVRQILNTKSPMVVEHALRGIWLLTAKLPASKYPLYIRQVPAQEDPRETLDRKHVYDRYKALEAEGMRPGKIKDTLHNEYGCTVRRIEQIMSL
jgi:hypothetical protein